MMADDERHKLLARPTEIAPRPTGGTVMPFTGAWERENQAVAGRIWQCLVKNFHEYEDLIKTSWLYAESPLEHALLSALLTEDSAFYFEGAPVLLRPGQSFEMPEPGGDAETARFIIAPQFRAQGTPYRIDIACAYTWTGKRVAVECDGHEFHERTKEQADHDKERDRVLLAAGWPTMRFPGSRVHKDPFACAAEVCRFLANDNWSPQSLIPESRR